ncbi:MAG TPA: phosphotransferase [Planctomycetota bacterium]|nr:phosphotransferase [Planctomycetota bacterium]
MIKIARETLEPYLASLLGAPVRILALEPLRPDGPAGASKRYGYGAPLRVEYEAAGRLRRAVLTTVRPGPFGHEDMSDRARLLLWSHRAYNRLPRHARSLDVGAILAPGNLVSLGAAEEFFLLTNFIEGRGYHEDLDGLKNLETPSALDLGRADALCDYLCEIHRLRGPDPALYTRRIRELVGHPECVMGLIDSYPRRHGFITRELLQDVERLCVEWRWRLKDLTYRLRQVHGDFHPWNILFHGPREFTVLDRSRGEWGEPADDVASLTLNYLFFALRRRGRPEGALDVLFRRFWSRYLSRSGDRQMLEVVPPFFAFRALVLASPLWYPDLPESVRRLLFRFMRNVLRHSRFDPERVPSYLERDP